MSLNIDSIDPLRSFALASGVLILLMLGIFVSLLFRRFRERRQTIAMTQIIIDYFQHSGVDVAVNCVSLRRDKRFTVLIESEPMKRFRLSHIIEATLRDHVHKVCGLAVEKIYWRFPIKQAATATSSADAKAAQAEDDYINEGLVHYKHLPKMEATEMPWETFEEVSTTIEPNKSETSEKSETSSAT